MDVNKIILYSKSYCDFCGVLNVFISELITELELDTNYEVIQIDTLPVDKYAYYAQIGAPFVEFYDSNNNVVFTAPGLAIINEEELLKDGYDMSKLEDEELFDLKCSVAKTLFISELINANVTILNKIYTDSSVLQQKFMESCFSLLNKRNELNESINELLLKSKIEEE